MWSWWCKALWFWLTSWQWHWDRVIDRTVESVRKSVMAKCLPSSHVHDLFISSQIISLERVEVSCGNWQTSRLKQKQNTSIGWQILLAEMIHIGPCPWPCLLAVQTPVALWLVYRGCPSSIIIWKLVLCGMQSLEPLTSRGSSPADYWKPL